MSIEDRPQNPNYQEFDDGSCDGLQSIGQLNTKALSPTTGGYFELEPIQPAQGKYDETGLPAFAR